METREGEEETSEAPNTLEVKTEVKRLKKDVSV